MNKIISGITALLLLTMVAVTPVTADEKGYGILMLVFIPTLV